MNTLDDLRVTLERHAEPGPGVDLGLVRDRAAGLRRRRRLTGGVAVAAAVAAVAAATPIIVRSPEPPPSGSATSGPVRAAAQTSITLRAGSPYTIRARQSDGVEQNVRVSADGRPGDGASVLAYDPGRFDPAVLTSGERVDLGGPQAWYQANLPVGPLDGPAVGWRDAGGSWVLVYGLSPAKRAGLLEVARDVRIGPVADQVSPVWFGWTPDGLAVVQSEVNGTSAQYGFGFGAERGAVGYARYHQEELPFGYTIGPVDPDWVNYEHDLEGRSPKVIGAAQTWYLTRPNTTFGGLAKGGADMIVRAGNCQFVLHVRDRARITEADLDRMLAGATYGDCADVTSWRPPLG